MRERSEIERRERWRVGATIIQQLQAVRTQQEVADELKVSRALIEHIEKEAAYKIRKRMMAMTKYEMLEIEGGIV